MLEELGAPAWPRRGAGDLEIVTGRQAVGARVRRLLSTAADELLVLGDPAVPLNPRVLIRRIDVPEVLARPASEAGQLRVCAELPTEFLIADRAVALVRIAKDSVLVVRSPALLATLVRLFELLWQSSMPASRRETESIEDGRADDRLLLLLATGLKDEAIARRLGVSLRTVHRRTSELLDRLGARTRFQAGVETVRRGLLLAEGERAMGHHG